MKFDLQELNKHSAAADTDSTFIVLSPILQKQHPELDLDDKDKVLP